MVSNTTPLPHPLPATHCLYILYFDFGNGGRGEGGEPERRLHCKKRLATFPSPTGMPLTTLSLGGNILIVVAHPGWGRECR